MQWIFNLALLPENSSGEVQRAMQRFALLAAAGDLATETGVTGWSPGDALYAAKDCFDVWLEERGGPGSSDIEKGVAQVLALIERHAGKFQDTKSTSRFRLPDRYGFVWIPEADRHPDIIPSPTSPTHAEYLIFPTAFRTVFCSGFDHKAICEALIERGYLVVGEKGKADAAHRGKDHRGQMMLKVADLGKQWFYVLRMKDCREVTAVVGAGDGIHGDPVTDNLL